MTLPLGDFPPVQGGLTAPAGSGALTFIETKCNQPATCFSSEKPHVRLACLLPRTRETGQQLWCAGSVPILSKNMPPKPCLFVPYHSSGFCHTSYSRQFANKPIANNCWILPIALKLFFSNHNCGMGKNICEKDLVFSYKGKYAKLQGLYNSK